MSTEVHPGSEQSLTTLVSGIVTDFQDLLTHQLQLARVEVKKDLEKSRDAALFLLLGAAICYLGALICAVSIAFLIYWLGAPAGTDPSKLPLWACLAIVGVPLGIVGGILASMGKQQFNTVHPLEASSEALKENLEWKTNQR